jgi:hypothetical protein
MQTDLLKVKEHLEQIAKHNSDNVEIRLQALEKFQKTIEKLPGKIKWTIGIVYLIISGLIKAIEYAFKLAKDLL